MLAAEGKRAGKHKSGHSYSLAEFGLEADAIRTQLADLFERFGWDEEPPRRRPTREVRDARRPGSACFGRPQGAARGVGRHDGRARTGARRDRRSRADAGSAERPEPRRGLPLPDGLRARRRRARLPRRPELPLRSPRPPDRQQGAPSTTRTPSTSPRPSTAGRATCVRGRAQDHRHWRGSPPAAVGAQGAPVPHLRAERRLPRRRLGQPRRDASRREDADGEARLDRDRGGGGRELRDPAGTGASRRAHGQLHSDAAADLATESRRSGGVARSLRQLPERSPALLRLGARGSGAAQHHSAGTGGRASAPLRPRGGGRPAAPAGRARPRADALLEPVLHGAARDLREARRQAGRALHAPQQVQPAQRGIAARPGAARARTSTPAGSTSWGRTRRS